MNSSQQNRVRLSVEALEHRDAPAGLTISPPGWIGAQVDAARSVAGHSHARPFHLVESGAAVINPDGTIHASASGQATHLGAFTLHDSSTIIGSEITPDGDVILHVAGLQADLQGADLEAANGDHLYASFTGSVNLTTGEGTLTFEWTGGTGRFAGATGATVWQVSLNPDLTYTAVADGVIRY
jgi:hypothetical protein